MTEDRNPHAAAVDVARHVAPAPVRGVALVAIRLAFGGEEERLVLSIPRPVSSEPHPAITISRQLQRVSGGAVLDGEQVELPELCTSRSYIDLHLPRFVQRVDRL